MKANCRQNEFRVLILLLGLCYLLFFHDVGNVISGHRTKMSMCSSTSRWSKTAIGSFPQPMVSHTVSNRPCSTGSVVSSPLKESMRKIDCAKKRFAIDGLDVALRGKKDSRVYAKKADGDFEAHLIALSYSKPPEGFARWALRLLANKVVELDYVDSISRETVRRVLTK